MNSRGRFAVCLVGASISAFAILFVGFLPSALATPLHPPLPTLDIPGLNQACGAAVDSEGDVYVASAGNPASEAIEVFSPQHALLATIEDQNRPCSLAVDSQGNLYASDTQTGVVVQYHPATYPLPGSPGYGPAVTIDNSGNAKGIAVDPTDDSLYVAEGNRVSSYQPDGTLGVNEVQSVRVGSTTTGGTFTLTFAGQETGPIAYDAPADTGGGPGSVEAALESLSNVDPGDISVAGGPGGSGPYLVTFEGGYAATDVPQLAVTPSLLPSQVEKLTVNATSGTYALRFEQSNHQVTSPIAYNAVAGKGEGAGSLEAALEALSDIGPGNVSVSGGPGGPGGLSPYLINFEGALAGQLVGGLEPNGASLTGSVTGSVTTLGASIAVSTKDQGFSGHIGEGELTNATGVASYTYRASEVSHRRRYLSVADAATDEIRVYTGAFDSEGFLPGSLEPRQTIDGSDTPSGSLGFGPQGAYLAADAGNEEPVSHKCASVAEQACTAGHLFVYDNAHAALDEFNAAGRYVTSVSSGTLVDAQPTAVAVDRSGGPHDGDVYVTSGASAGAELLAFGPLAAPGRPAFGEPPSLEFTNACGTVVDSHGDLYVAGEAAIRVYGPAGDELASISDPGHPCYLAVDSEGNLYAANRGTEFSGDERVVVYQPQAFPPQDGTTYSEKASPVDTGNEPRGIAVDLANDHLFVTHSLAPVTEYDAAKKGSGLLNPSFGGIGGAMGIDVSSANGDVYVVAGGAVNVYDSTGVERLAQIDGSGSPGGVFSNLNDVSIAVDQSDGHVLVGAIQSRGDIEEYDASGAFVGRYGSFANFPLTSDIAIDNSGGSRNGDLYVAYRNELSVFGPLAYGEPPTVLTNVATGVGGGNATLHGTVNPRGFAVEDCHFEYMTHDEYVSAGETFAGAATAACVPGSVEIGKGSDPVSVQAAISLLEPKERYLFRLVAKNKYGESESKAGLFGPPALTQLSAQPIRYLEASLRGTIDPSGLTTKYHFEYGGEGGYGHSTPVAELGPGDGAVEIEAPLTGLSEGSEYHFRLVAENEDAVVEGPDQSFETLARLESLSCQNATLRLENHSAHLPDCRAYELVTPADTRGSAPGAEGPGGLTMPNNWLTAPSGSLAGERLAFFIDSTLPGSEGNGILDAYRAMRSSTGWSSDLFSPTFVQKGDGQAATQQGISPDQLYSFWAFGGASPGALPPGHYLRTPGGFEPIGEGSLGTDLFAEGRFVSAGASHVIFTTRTTVEGGPPIQLETAAPPSPVGTVYDRSPGGMTHVISLPPDGASPEVLAEFKTLDATYLGASSDGSSVAFALGGKLYLRRDDSETVKVADSAAGFAGVSDAGSRVFYEAGGADFVFDTNAQAATEIAPAGKFVNVSSDGAHAYFTSEEALTGPTEENEAGQIANSGAPDLYAWDEAGTHFVGVLDSKDLQSSGSVRFPGTSGTDQVGLDSWVAQCVNPTITGRFGNAACPSRTVATDGVLVFQSHADLTPPYQGQGHSEIYRYAPQAPAGKRLLCVSCDPSDFPATADADLQSFTSGPSKATTVIPGMSSDGSEVFFQTTAALLPEDGNSVLDVYEWQEQGEGGCLRAGGCLALISSGQSDNPSYIYSMSADGHDVFFSTLEKLVSSDVTGSPSIYDARVDGGFPGSIERESCRGDACQGLGASPPSRPVVRSDISSSGNAKTGGAGGHCPKGKRKARNNGRPRCPGGHGRKHHKGRRTNANRRTAR